MTINRRKFMTYSAGTLGALALSNNILSAAELNKLQEETDTPQNILVILQLSGGNDGLSTVVPYADDAYGRARSSTRIAPSQVLKIDNYRGLHPNLKGLHDLYGSGKLAIIEGTGYPDPVRSHFKSLDIWHAGNSRGRNAGYGWVGQTIDKSYPDIRDPNVVVHIGNKTPFSLNAAIHKPVAFTTPAAYRWIGAEKDAATLQKSAPLCEHEKQSGTPKSASGRDRALARLRRILHEAQASSSQIRQVAKNYSPKAKYPRSGLSASLATVAALITGGMSTRIYSLEMTGFDTHTNHRNKHDRLMTQLDGALSAFQKDLQAHGKSGSVTTMLFSEFGRRVQENGSQGLDHGVAGPMFLLGDKVKGGLHGKHPSLTKLDKGDLIHTTDFRQVYASLIDNWIGGNHAQVLGKNYKSLPLFQS